MSQYRKGYRREKIVREYFEEHYRCECVESRGSRGVADLICGSGIAVYVIQVKDYKKRNEVNVPELKEFAQKFRGLPVLVLYEKYKPLHLIWY